MFGPSKLPIEQLLTLPPSSLSIRTSTTLPQVGDTNSAARATTYIPVAALEVKLKAPNGVNFTAKGTSAHNGPVTSSVSCSQSVVRDSR
jgi:hypothetical protein